MSSLVIVRVMREGVPLAHVGPFTPDAAAAFVDEHVVPAGGLLAETVALTMPAQAVEVMSLGQSTEELVRDLMTPPLVRRLSLVGVNRGEPC